MASPVILKIIGADADIAGTETPSYPGDFALLPGKVEADIRCYDLGAGIILETDENEYADKRIYVDGRFFGMYNVKVLYRRYPAEKCSFDCYLPELAVLRKPFKWIYSSNYNIGFEVEGRARAVNLMNWNETRFHEYMMVELELRHRKAE